MPVPELEAPAAASASLSLSLPPGSAIPHPSPPLPGGEHPGLALPPSSSTPPTPVTAVARRRAPGACLPPPSHTHPPTFTLSRYISRLCTIPSPPPNCENRPSPLTPCSLTPSNMCLHTGVGARVGRHPCTCVKWWGSVRAPLVRAIPHHFVHASESASMRGRPTSLRGSAGPW